MENSKWVSCRSLNRIAKAKHRDCVWFSGHTHTFTASPSIQHHTHTLHNAVCNGCSSISRNEKHKFTPSLAAKSAHVDLYQQKAKTVEWSEGLCFHSARQAQTHQAKQSTICECMCSIRASSSVWAGGVHKWTKTTNISSIGCSNLWPHISKVMSLGNTEKQFACESLKEVSKPKQGLTLFTFTSEGGEGDGAGVPEKHCETSRPLCPTLCVSA